MDPGFGIIDIPAVAEGVELTQCVGHGAGGGALVGILDVVLDDVLIVAPLAVDQSGHVALRVLQVEVLRTIVLHYKFTTFCPTLQPYIHFPATFSSLFRRT